MLEFPKEFTWGAATSSYQIEGAVNEEGRGKSIWDTFCKEPGNVHGGDTGAVASDHYHRYKEDVDLMAHLNLNAYRFSIAWPRILSEGVGEVNPAGLDFYDRLVNELLKHHIKPFVTLYHWDLPQSLQDKGGWINRDSVRWFAEYAAVIADRLGDRVKYWITHNEPWVVAYVGHAFGDHAPGMKDWGKAVQASHHLLLSHGEVVPILREYCGANAQVGITLNLHPAYPATDTEADKEAAHRFDGFMNRWFLDPVFNGEYPQDMLELYKPMGLEIRDGDLETISVPVDFLGINYYTRTVIQKAEGGPLGIEMVKPSDAELTEMGWEIYPEGLYRLLTRVTDDYSPPALYITENGAAFDDEVSDDGKVHDPKRVDYLREHFRQAHRAIEAGVPLKGYFVWSFMDNFEWAHGYSKRFGITYVDYETQERIPKDSAAWYRDVIAANGLT
ncbi:MAG: GH1 family beta-glucosidase [Candidatus Bipolaricaulia bacterium]